MTDAHTHGPDADAALTSPAALLLGWARPAAVCGLVIAGLFFVSPFAGGIVGIAGIAYLATSLVLVVIVLQQAGATRPRPLVVTLAASWTSAWVLGVVSFGLVALFLGAFDAGGATPSEGFVISPIFWLLSFPMYVVFLLTALVLGSRRHHLAAGRGSGRSREKPT